MKYFDRVKETTTTTGTGDITLAGAVSQFVSFSSRFAIGEKIPYAIVGQTGTEWETGIGTLSGASTFVRTVVLESSNADAAVSFSSGTKDVFCSLVGRRMSHKTTRGEAYATSRGVDSSF